MTKFVIDKENGKGKLLDVTLAYIKLQSGDFKYQSKTEREYSLDCIVDKKTAKEYKKNFPKNSCKEIDTAEFKDKFKIDPVFPDEDDQYIIKLKADAQLKREAAGLPSGTPIPYEWNTRPKLFVPMGKGVQDKTMSILAANGSKGDVAFKILENDFGTFSQLTGVLVKDLIEYETKDSSESDFGEIIGGLNPGDGNPQQVPTEVEDTPGNTPEDNAQKETEGFNDVPPIDEDIPF
jgi:hypothetical protein